MFNRNYKTLITFNSVLRVSLSTAMFEFTLREFADYLTGEYVIKSLTVDEAGTRTTMEAQ